MLGVVFGKRSNSRILLLLAAVRQQMQGRRPRLVTSDSFNGYATVLELIWPAKGKDDPAKGASSGSEDAGGPLNYATVCKQLEKGRVVAVERTVVSGTEQSVALALEQSSVSSSINTSFLERQHGTDRHRNSRKARRTYRFSKDWTIHEAAGYFTLYSYNFCWCVRTLAIAGPDGRRQKRTPAMSAGLTDHVWPLREWLLQPVPYRST